VAATTSAEAALPPVTSTRISPRRRALLWVGLVMFGASFFLPAIWPDEPPREMFSVTKPLPGWLGCVFGWLCLTDGTEFAGALVGGTCLTNLAMLVGVVAGRFRGRRRFAFLLLLSCAVYDLAWLFVVPVSQLAPGYYVWIASFAVCGAALRPDATPSPDVA
jgi:hypothetical protein